MKRRIVLFLLLLLAGGAIVNVAVAWGLEFRPSQTTYPIGYEWQSADGHHMLEAEFGRLRVTQVVIAPDQGISAEVRNRRYSQIGANEAAKIVPSWCAVAKHEQMRARDLAAGDWALLSFDHGCGWPMLVVRYSFSERYTLLHSNSTMKHSTSSHCDGLMLPTRWVTADRMALPYEPIWPGFGINTIFYALVLWMLFAFPFVVRRWRRLQRGLCVNCAYDLRGRGAAHEVCPECGTAIEHRQPTTETPKAEIAQSLASELRAH